MSPNKFIAVHEEHWGMIRTAPHLRFTSDPFAGRVLDRDTVAIFSIEGTLCTFCTFCDIYTLLIAKEHPELWSHNVPVVIDPTSFHELLKL